MIVTRDLVDLRRNVRAWRSENASIGLVPTMGALHEGHLALVEYARQRHDRVVASIFVNPTQFGPNEDFASYPRRENEDLRKFQDAGVDLAWLPSVETMYPADFATRIVVSGLPAELEGQVRPGHFDGVATVVAKLFGQVQPDCAYFGEKDYQQLLVIRRMASDLNIAVEIIGVPTVRAPDGLALSSRNLYLTQEQRQIAAALPRIIGETAAAIGADGSDSAGILSRARSRLAEAGFGAVDYLELRDAESLAVVDRPDRPARLLAAVRLGRTRLLDNIPVSAAEAAQKE
jgi:pantoate--beta-alanine ligase